MKFYFDSSALLKRYVSEQGSDLMDGLFLEAETVAVGSIALPEVVSGLTRLRREGRLTSHQYALCKKAVLEEFEAFDVCPLSPEVLGTTVHILERCELRASDAIHVASAVHMKADRFVTGDLRQLSSANQFRLKTEKV